jgi:hypothetical protein
MATRKKAPARKGFNRKHDANAQQLLLPVTPKGVTGLKRTAGFVYDEWHPKLQGQQAVKVFTEMADNDAVIRSYLNALAFYARSADVKINAADDSNFASMIADHIQTCIDDMSMTRREFVGSALTMAPMGFSWHEIVYKVRRGPKAELSFLRSKHNDGLVGWHGLPIRSQDTLWEWDFADNGDIRGAYQHAPPYYVRTHLPIEDGLLFRADWNKNNPEGRSLLRGAYRSWYFLKIIQDLEAIGVERDLVGLLVFHMPTEYFSPDADDNQKASVTDYRKVADRVRRGVQEGLVFPAEDQNGAKTGWQARLMQGGGRRPMDVNEIIKRLESRIAISVLGEAVLLGMQGNVGSWALSNSKTHMMAMGIKSLMDSVADTMTRFAIPRLVRRNGWPEDLSPTWEFSDIETDDATELAASLSSLGAAGFITPDEAIEEYLRTRMARGRIGRGCDPGRCAHRGTGGQPVGGDERRRSGGVPKCLARGHNERDQAGAVARCEGRRDVQDHA